MDTGQAHQNFTLAGEIVCFLIALGGVIAAPFKVFLTKSEAAKIYSTVSGSDEKYQTKEAASFCQQAYCERFEKSVLRELTGLTAQWFSDKHDLEERRKEEMAEIKEMISVLHRRFDVVGIPNISFEKKEPPRG